MNIGPKKTQNQPGLPDESGTVINKPPSGTSRGRIGRSSGGGPGRRPGCPVPILTLLALFAMLLARRQR